MGYLQNRRRILTRSFGALLLVSTLGAATAPARASSATPAWLTDVNQARAWSGLAAVTADSTLNTAMTAHLHYLDLNPVQGAGYRVGNYASAHSENPQAPGYTAAGAQVAGESDIAFGTASDVAAVDAWRSAPVHLASILNPSLTAAGFVRDPKTGNAMLDVGNPADTNGPRPNGDILAPGAGGRTDLTRFGGESPDPTQTCRHLTDSDISYGAGPTPASPHRLQSGLPLTANLFNAKDMSTTTVSATLTSPGGTVSGTDTDAAHGLCVIDAKDFYTTDGVYGPVAASWLGSGLVIIVPAAPLVPGAYAMTLRVSGRPDLTWTFTSAPKPMPVRLDGYNWSCSFTNPAYASGEFGGSLLNPPDTGTAESYAVTLNRVTHVVSHVPDGRVGTIPTFSRLPTGKYTLHVAGLHDHTTATIQFTIPPCPAALGLMLGKVGFNPRTYALSMPFDNRRNLGAVSLVITRTHLTSIKFRVAGKSTKTVQVGVHHHGTTTITGTVNGQAAFSFTMTFS